MGGAGGLAPLLTRPRGFRLARYEHLPIYRAAFDLAVHIEKIVSNFSRYHKYTLGTELRDGSRRHPPAHHRGQRGPPRPGAGARSPCGGRSRASRSPRGWPRSRGPSPRPGRTSTSPSRWWGSPDRTRAGCARCRRPAREAKNHFDQGRRGTARTGRAERTARACPFHHCASVPPTSVRNRGGHVDAGCRTPATGIGRRWSRLTPSARVAGRSGRIFSARLPACSRPFIGRRLRTPTTPTTPVT